jgi:hypothetical protein
MPSNPTNPRTHDLRAYVEADVAAVGACPLSPIDVTKTLIVKNGSGDTIGTGSFTPTIGATRCAWNAVVRELPDSAPYDLETSDGVKLASVDPAKLSTENDQLLVALEVDPSGLVTEVSLPHALATPGGPTPSLSP